MKSIKWISLKTWQSWTAEQRGQFEQDCENRNIRWALDLKAPTLHQVLEQDQKDFDEEKSGETR